MQLKGGLAAVGLIPYASAGSVAFNLILIPAYLCRTLARLPIAFREIKDGQSSRRFNTSVDEMQRVVDYSAFHKRLATAHKIPQERPPCIPVKKLAKSSSVPCGT